MKAFLFYFVIIILVIIIIIDIKIDLMKQYDICIDNIVDCSFSLYVDSNNYKCSEL